MIRRALHILRHSIAAQVIVPAILLVVIAGLLVVQLAQRDQPLPMTIENTYARLLEQLYLNVDDGRLDVRAYLNSDAVRRTRRVNPDFDFSFFGDRRVYGAAPDPLLAQLLRRLPLVDEASLIRRCQSFTAVRPPTRESGGASIAFSDCDDDVFYVELRNVRRPVDFMLPDPNGTFLDRLGAVLTGNLVAIGLALLLVAVIGALGYRAMRRIARVAQDFDPERGRDTVPLNGLAMEVRPLARIINALAGRLRDSYRRQQLFLAAAAHELRTPLAVLRVRAESLAPSPDKDGVIRDIRTLTHIANQLLALTGIGGGQDDRHDFLLAAALEDVVLDMREEAPGQSIALRLPANEHLVRGGNARLFAVAILNLLRNAASVSPPGAPITVTLAPDGRITVEDCGPGIDPSIRDRLFEPFVKYPDERDGSGMGLAIVWEVVAFHDGRIAWFEPADGGTGFEIDLRAEPFVRRHRVQVETDLLPGPWIPSYENRE